MEFLGPWIKPESIRSRAVTSSTAVATGSLTYYTRPRTEPESLPLQRLCQSRCATAGTPVISATLKAKWSWLHCLFQLSSRLQPHTTPHTCLLRRQSRCREALQTLPPLASTFLLQDPAFLPGSLLRPPWTNIPKQTNKQKGKQLKVLHAPPGFLSSEWNPKL